MLKVLVSAKLILLSMVKKTLLILCLGLMLSSCFAVHPELQSAKSEDKGAHGYSIGVYGGANVLVETYGVAGVYNYGLTDKVNWSTDFSFSVQVSSLKRVFQVLVSINTISARDQNSVYLIIGSRLGCPPP